MPFRASPTVTRYNPVSGLPAIAAPACAGVRPGEPAAMLDQQVSVQAALSWLAVSQGGVETCMAGQLGRAVQLSIDHIFATGAFGLHS